MTTRRWLMAVLVGMSLIVQLVMADGLVAEQDNAQQSSRPFATLTGADSRVKERSYHLVKSEKDWIKIWQRHKGAKESDDYDRFYNPLGLPEVNFDKCMVIAAFQGSGWNSAGLSTTAINEEKNRIVFRFISKDYQTAGPDGGGRRVTVYGFFVLPRSGKTVVVEEEHRSLNPKVPPSWTKRATFCEARNECKLASQPFPPEMMLSDAPRTARDIEAFRSLRSTMTMIDVVRKCGLPDEHQGSGIYIFVYRLRDGSTVNIGTGDLKSLLYAQHVDKSGNRTPLIPETTTH
jgi:hypothetical protein